MELTQFFKSIIDLDEQAIVICDVNHVIIYMNSAACERYKKRGGAELVGKNLLDCHNPNSGKVINEILDKFRANCDLNKIFTYHSVKPNTNDDVYVIAIRDERKNLIGYYEKFENKDLVNS